jgi:very-short-patch-repair endonuclease
MRIMVEGAQSGGMMRAPALTFKRATKLRRDMSLPEVILWEPLRRGGLDGMRFRRQHPVGPYVLDFYCAASRLAIEVDGVVHDLPGQMHHDNRRDAWLARRGIRTLRIAASDVLEDRRWRVCWW